MGTAVNKGIIVKQLFENGDGSCKWDEEHDVKGAIKELKLPTGGMDKANLKMLEQDVRQTIYRYRDWQWENNGRLLLAIKLGKGQTVKYLYSKKSTLYTNDRVRIKGRIEPRVKKYLETTHAIEKRLTGAQVDTATLHFNKDSLIQIDKPAN